MPASQSQRWYLRPTLDLDSDKFWCFNHRRWIWQCSITSELQIACGFINFTMGYYISQENPWNLAIIESSTRLLIHSWIHASDTLHTYRFQVSERLHGGPEFLPRAHAQGVKQSVCMFVVIVVVIVVGTKIARSRVLGIYACWKHNQSVDIGEKLVYACFKFLKKAY